MNFTKLLYSGKAKIKEHSPEILMVAGAVSFVGTIVLACRATTKVSKIMDSHREQMNSVSAMLEKKTYEEENHESGKMEVMEYTEKDAKKDKAIIFAHTALDLSKEYGPAVLLGIASISCFVGAYAITHGRYVAASTLAAGLSKTLENYRNRVKEELGAEMDEHFLNGTVREKADVLKDDGEGNIKKSKDYIQTLPDGTQIPIYAKFFDEYNVNWSKSPSINLMFLSGMQARANDMFKVRGYLLLNEVYAILGFPATDIGGMVGWFENHGDQFVDFGIYDGSERKRAFVNGYEASILLNFNCVPKMEGDLAYA